MVHTGALRKTAEEELMKRAREGIEEGDAEFSVLVGFSGFISGYRYYNLNSLFLSYCLA